MSQIGFGCGQFGYRELKLQTAMQAQRRYWRPRRLPHQREQKRRESRLVKQVSTRLDDMWSQVATGAGQNTVLNLVVKADVQGSAEALRDSLTRLSTDNIKINVVASGVGGGILALVPGELAVAVWSPGLDASGNSLAGTMALELFTTLTARSIF